MAKSMGAATPIIGSSERSRYDRSGFEPSYIPRFTTPEKYIDARVAILRDHLCIEVTDEDVAYLREFETEAQINAAVRTIINKHWK